MSGLVRYVSYMTAGGKYDVFVQSIDDTVKFERLTSVHKVIVIYLHMYW
jgi:hypothetical protein